jgi:hypothetical protein
LAKPLLPADQPVDAGFELGEPHEPDVAHGAVAVDEDVRRHAADVEQAGVLAGLVEQDRPLDSPDLAEPGGFRARVDAFPDVDQNDVEARPGLLASA